MNPKIVTKSYLKKIRNKNKDKKIVFTNGCFDILHLGHVRYLQKAKGFGDILVVGVNSDSSVRRLKGKGRPIMPQKDRMEILASLGCVDYVVLFNELTPAKLIRSIEPDVLVKGADYKLDEIVGREFVKEVRTVPLVKGRSTSKIICKINSIA